MAPVIARQPIPFWMHERDDPRCRDYPVEKTTVQREPRRLDGRDRIAALLVEAFHFLPREYAGVHPVRHRILVLPPPGKIRCHEHIERVVRGIHAYCCAYEWRLEVHVPAREAAI